MNIRILRLCLLILVVAAPAFAQPATDTCTGQPALTTAAGDSFMVNTLFPAFGQDFTVPQVGTCQTGAGWNHDAVVCFTTQNSCTPGIQVTPSVATETVAILLTTGTCNDVVQSGDCVQASQGVAGGPAVLTGAALNLVGGTQYCVYAFSFANPSTAFVTFDFTNMTACGDLPVELQGFTVNGEPRSKAEPAKTNAHDQD